MRNKLPNTCTALVSARQQVHRSSNTWFMCIGVNILCCLSFAALDYSTLFSLFDNNMVAAAWAISIFTFGICVAENFLPMISARFLHQIITLKRKDCSRILLLIISLLLAITLLAFLGNARRGRRRLSIKQQKAALLSRFFCFILFSLTFLNDDIDCPVVTQNPPSTLTNIRRLNYEN